jgi:tRNA 2-selenouridine synthase
MAIEKLNIEQFLELPKNVPILDVRSPSEFAHAHIPGAHSFSIFDDEERRIIGTAYKKETREKAIRIGLDAFGKKMSTLVLEAEALLKKEKIESREFRVHCWRGGMRSAAMAWLLDLYGYKVYLLNGGYKSYRRLMVSAFERNWPLVIMGGYTGSNKTGLLLHMKKHSEPVIDLEGLAGHMGSAFGNLDLIPQPSQEMFENVLATELITLKDANQIWLEGESQRIGLVNIPKPLYIQMQAAKYYFLDIPFEERLKHILTIYGKGQREKIMNATVRLQKRLGGLETKNAVSALLEDDLPTCFRILLHYYDRLYLKVSKDKEPNDRKLITIELPDTNAEKNYSRITSHVRTNRD